MNSYSSRDVIAMLEADGWRFARQRGDHIQYKHPIKKGLVTVQHPVKDLNINVLKSIERQAGIKFR